MINQKKLQVVVLNIVLGMGGEVRQVKSYSRLVIVCAKVAKVQMGSKTLAHDCKCAFLITEDTAA